MAKEKFFPPLGKGKVHKISQTYHGENASRPTDLSAQVAIDLSCIPGTPVYAVADGKIANATASYGSYCTLDIGLPFYILYVHTYKWLPVGTKVKRGQIIAYIAPISAPHLHIGMKNKNGRPPHPEIMDFLDREINFVSGHPDISRIWFEGGKLKWSLFKDKYIKIEGEEEVTKKEHEKQMNDLKKKLQKELDKQKAKTRSEVNLRKALQKEIKSISSQNEKLQKDLEEQKKTRAETISKASSQSEVAKLDAQIKSLELRSKKSADDLEAQVQAYKSEIVELKETNAKVIEDLNGIRIAYNELNNVIASYKKEISNKDDALRKLKRGSDIRTISTLDLLRETIRRLKSKFLSG